MKKALLSLLFLVLIFTASTAQQAVGQWTDHLSFRQVHSVVDVGDLIYCATPEAIFSYNKESGVIGRTSKVNGLSDVGVSSLAYNSELELLIVGYSNGNLDFIVGDDIQNLADIKRSNVIGDKQIYDIHLDGEFAWLSCGFGVVLINLANQEIADTYIIGPGASNVKVNSITRYNGQVYAASDVGLFMGSLNTNLADFGNWSLDSTLDEPMAAYDLLTVYQNKLFVKQVDDDEVLFFDADSWLAVPGTIGNNNVALSVSGDDLILARGNSVKILDSNLNTVTQFAEYSFDAFPSILAAIRTDDGVLWVGDITYGLVRRTEEDLSIIPSGPYSSKAWRLDASDGQVWVAHGELKNNWDNLFNNDTSSGLLNGEWMSIKGRTEVLSMRDFVNVRVDPVNADRVVFASFLKGVLVLKKSSDELTLYNLDEGNSPIDSSNQNSDRFQTGGIDFDPSGNLWVTNSYTDEPLKVLDTEGEWHVFDCPGAVSGNDLFGEIECGANGVNWVVMPRGEGLFVYSAEGTLASTNDDQCKRLNTSVGSGQLPTNDVYAVAEDLDGEIWIGTSEGPAVNYNPGSIFNNDPSDFQQILIEQDGNVEVLLGGQVITAIAIDGADRKWFGTQGGGVFLMSEDGGDQILRFTSDNSPLLSDDINDIAIEPTTGEVFFATQAGLVSYKGDATASNRANDCISVFPNPVREHYSGPITIDGLVADSDIKITDVSGNLVYQTTSNGGRATWNGNDFSGSRVSTGVYFAHSTSRDGESGCTAKILLVN